MVSRSLDRKNVESVVMIFEKTKRAKKVNQTMPISFCARTCPNPSTALK
jgi:hypothetical protein